MAGLVFGDFSLLNSNVGLKLELKTCLKQWLETCFQLVPTRSRRDAQSPPEDKRDTKMVGTYVPRPRPHTPTHTRVRWNSNTLVLCRRSWHGGPEPLNRPPLQNSLPALAQTLHTRTYREPSCAPLTARGRVLILATAAIWTRARQDARFSSFCRR